LRKTSAILIIVKIRGGQAGTFSSGGDYGILNHFYFDGEIK